VAGGAIWGAALLGVRPAPTDTAWAVALLLLAPLVLVPCGLGLLGPSLPAASARGAWRLAVVLQFPAALLLGVGFCLARGLPAVLLALPWLGVTALLAWLGLGRLRRGWSELGPRAALGYVSVGAFWAVLDRGGVRPLGFEPVIVLLTAIHFHFAGFALPLLTGLAARRVEGRRAWLAVMGGVVAVPLVAVGITATQLRAGPWLECGAAGLMAVAGGLTGYLYFRLACQPSWPPLVRGLWGVAAVSLTGSMVLAALYGVRFFLPLPWLDIPTMRAWHGTANALGFGLAGSIGWALAWPPVPGD